MPPQVKVSKEKILNTAFEMTRESGFESVTARKLAERLNCSTQPIFRVYENMDALKRDLFFMGADMFSEYMKGKSSKKTSKDPAYLTLGMAYIEMARKEANLFKLIAAIEDFQDDDIKEFLLRGDVSEYLDSLPDTESLSPKEKRELFMAVWFITHGIATLVVSNRSGLSDKEIRGLVTKTYTGLLNELKGK